MNILVTGCAGYIGSMLCHYLLNAGYKVTGIDNIAISNERALLGLLGDPEFRFHKIDVRDISSLKPLVHATDVVIPLAALVGAPICERKPKEAHEINLKSISNLVALLSRQQRLIFPNTNSGYGQTNGTTFVTEDDKMAPLSVYGQTKCEAEKVVLNHPNSVVFRLATVFGLSPRMRFDLLVNDWTQKLSCLKHYHTDSFGNIGYLKVYEGHFKRNFVHVRDVARAFSLAVCDLSGVYNLGLPTANLSKLQLAHLICDVVGLPRHHIKECNGEDKDKRNCLVSSNKIMETGYYFRHTLEDGVREVAQIVPMLSIVDVAMMRNTHDI